MKKKFGKYNVNYIKQGKGKNVIIVPGWGTNINVYKVLIDEISKYACVYCFDMPGYGESDEPKEPMQVIDFVGLLDDFIKINKIKKCSLIGHSNGGKTIIKYLANEVNKKSKVEIDKVILIGSSGIKNRKTFKQWLSIKKYKAAKILLKSKLIKKIKPDFEDKVKSKFGSEDYKNASPVMKKTLVNVVNEYVKDNLKNIDRPTLLIWGENDTATPIKNGEVMEKLIPDAGLVRMKNCTHYCFLERPGYVNNVIKTFIDD